ncbi:hypothetical protein SAMN02982985_00817 [Rugamonas rubra]|uniref:Uncharacterized protein n=1 Tax=Rugamonas rubra TaxID=758825 RepID=A0A1I4IX68_9BURK|nr:hypothetical protein SAMN02982985_00817 [Rugamonas rubra]
MVRQRTWRRRALRAGARDIGAIVVEDDHDSAFRYGAGPPTRSREWYKYWPNLHEKPATAAALQVE